MSNFYGQYIGFGSGTSGGAGQVWYGTRGVIAGGYASSNVIDYVTIANTGGTALDFGNLVVGRRGVGHASDGTFGVWFAGRNGGSFSNHMDYVTIATPVTTATDFGNLSDSSYGMGSCQDGIYGIRWGGGSGEKTIIEYWTNAVPQATASSFGDLTVAGGSWGDGVNDATHGLLSGIGNVTGGYTQDLIQVITVATPGDAVDWGADLHFGTYHFGTVSSAAGRGLMSGGWGSAMQDQIQYVTIASAVNGSDFGNMLAGSASNSGVNDAERGIFTRGYLYYNNMEYITMSTLADAQDFGDLSVGRSYAGGCSGG